MTRKTSSTPQNSLRFRPLGGGWIEGTFEGHRFQAKVYDVGSVYGIGEGRVSKLCVWTGAEKFEAARVIYNYDRGLDVDAAPAGLIDRLVACLERWA